MGFGVGRMVHDGPTWATEGLMPGLLWPRTFHLVRHLSWNVHSNRWAQTTSVLSTVQVIFGLFLAHSGPQRTNLGQFEQ